MEQKIVASWEEFLIELEVIRRQRESSADYEQNSPLLFRGQADYRWPLRSTLERVCERMPYKDYYRIIAKIKSQIESLVGGDWPIPPLSGNRAFGRRIR